MLPIKFYASLCLGLIVCQSSAGSLPVEADVIVYGGTSGGVAAAVAAARLGKSVVLLTQNNHVGGMSSGGLGVTDIGTGNNTAYIGGISREFYRRVGQKYGLNDLKIWFEPHVAEEVFRDLLSEAKVPIYSNQLIASVTMNAQRIHQITMEDGSVYRGRMFIDTSYEGDLMAGAGVSFTVGREGTNVYGESLAGIRPLAGQFTYDPYIVPGDPASGLLPLVQSNAPGVVGGGDHRLQAYNFRLCLTQNATNRIAIAPPANYSEARYELFRRYINARLTAGATASLSDLIHIQQIIPNGKTDINANNELSTDYVGYSHTWATNSHAGRALLRQEHEDYIRGMFQFFATSPGVPASLRAETQSWGLAKDEFTDTGGWPHQIYVREARRMIGDYVMIQQNADGRRTAPEPIALGRYTIDSHGVQRQPFGGNSRWEGSIGGSVPFPYGISYRSIVPRTGECQNVFSTFALSASHVGFASARMEPVFMMTSQGAATAACLAIDDDVSVQQLAYERLSAQLRADGQILTWESASTSTNGILMDEDSPGTSFSGAWSVGANAGGYLGDYWHDQSSGKGTKWVRYVPTLPTNGTYEVYLWWVENSNRSSNTAVDIAHAAGTTRVLVDQRAASGGWFRVLTTNFSQGTLSSVTILNVGTTVGTYVIADGVRFNPVGAIAPVATPVIELVAGDAAANEFGPNPGRFSLVRSGDTNAALTIGLEIFGTAINGLDCSNLASVVSLPPGVTATNFFVRPIADSLVEGTETVHVKVLPGVGYGLKSLTNVTINLGDRPIDQWRAEHFNGMELVQTDLSGDLADPDGDRLSNLMEYALGCDPRAVVPTERPYPRVQENVFLLDYSIAKAASDAVIELSASTDLANWAPGALEVVAESESGGLIHRTVRLKGQVSEASPAYIRIKARRL